LLLVLVFALANKLKAQITELGSLLSQDSRAQQLLDGKDSLKSFALRSTIYNWSSSNNNAKSKLLDFKVLPVYFTNQYNSHHPYGYNDGSMIAASGFQTQIAAGFAAKAGPLQIQLMPDFVNATNSNYPTNTQYGSINNKPYQKFSFGQSAISISANAFSLGVGTNNIWWGPGITSALLMSDNAPGFGHLFLKTRRPAKTPIGNFEFELIGGKLENDSSLPYENTHLKYRGLKNNWRYYNAYVFSYQPKWIPNMFVGMTRGMQRPGPEVMASKSNFTNKYLPIIFKTLQKQNDWGDDTLNTDQLASFFVRWVFPKSHSEFYVEYGYNDYGQSIRDYLMGPTHSAAHIAGFKKIVPLTDKKYLDFNIEITQLSQSPDAITRNAGNWYVHGQIAEGYTQMNQIIGAGAGFAANKQIIATTLVNGTSKLGVLLERVERDPEYHAYKWTDMSIGILPQYKYKNCLIGVTLQFINSANYMWEKDLNEFNFHGKLNLVYFIHSKSMP